MLEKDIEDKVCKYAQEEYKMLTRKYTSPAHRSVPDRLFLGYGDHHFFIEFKKPGGELTPGQIREHDKLMVRGHRVYVIRTVEEGKRVIDNEYQVHQILLSRMANLRTIATSSPQLSEESN